MGEIPDYFEIYIPTSEERLGPVAKQIPGVASKTGDTVQSHKFGLDLWMTLVKLLLEILDPSINCALLTFTSCSIVPSLCSLLPM